MIKVQNADGCCTVTLARPDKANALTEEMLEALASATTDGTPDGAPCATPPLRPPAD